MKKIALFTLLMAALSGCSSMQNKSEKNVDHAVGMANPASEYCVSQGGKLEIRDEANGQVGYCHLPNGQVVEEWALFRSANTQCNPEEAKKLIGQSNLTDEQIKKLTKATNVRNVAPGQPVTMDFRSDRVTVVTDPKTKIISNASCG